MRIKRYFGFSLILFIMIFSMSFAYANDNVTNDINSNDLSAISAPADVNLNANLNDESLNTVDTQVSDEIKSDSAEMSSTSKDLADENLYADEIESDDKLTNNGKVPTLRANSDEEILGDDHNLYGGTAQQVMDMIQQISNEGGGTLYLHGGTYTGSGTLGNNLGQYQSMNIANVRVVGGSPNNPNQMAIFQPDGTAGTSLAFRGYRTYADGADRSYSTSGVNLLNVTFENLNCTGRFFSFSSGSLTDCVFNNLESYQHLFFVIGSYMDSVPIRLTNVNFTNSKQTYVGDSPEGGTDGSGQFGVVFGAEMYGCNFINTSSATHGGAFCLSDEWVTSACVASKLVDCNFINITSRWFAVYIHGNYTDTPRFITQSQVVENCKFINCTGTGEYGGALGISHNNVIINNSEFINNTGGEGAAIMVGGIRNTHDGFLGVNTEGNNITIDKCTFNGNVVKIEGQSSSHSYDPEFYTVPTGNAGAVYVYGNDTKIIDSTFDNNTAVACGAAIYIEGQNTTVVGSEFYDHKSANGTIYLVGHDCEIRDSNFHNNNATSTGSCIYIQGNRAEIDGTTFLKNTAPNGGCVYIVGHDTHINDSEFTENTAVNGAGAYIVGHDTEINQTRFYNNHATNGGAVYILGSDTNLNSNEFSGNNVSNQGGAVYIEGNQSLVELNRFLGNEATPEPHNEDAGLGGAIFVHGDNTTTLTNIFSYNKARNGSAIYTDGKNFTLENDLYYENQAWSYRLIVTAVPEESYYQTSEVNITINHRGGDNIINAIHNRADASEIHFKNVTYINSYGDIIHTNVTDFVSPVMGVENSDEGRLLYQDDREDHQTIVLQVMHEADGDLVYYDSSLKTDIYGNAYATLPLSVLTKKGKYDASAEHKEDWNYKLIYNMTDFRIADFMDLSINKTSDMNEYFQDEISKWNLTIHNTNNGTDAEYVTITDFLPNVFRLTNLTFVLYDNTSVEWTNGTLDLSTSTLRFGVYNISSGDWVYADAAYDESTNTWTYYTLNFNGKTYAYTAFDPNDYTDDFGPILINNATDICYRTISYIVVDKKFL